jgi:hypothetical protein
VAAGVELAGCKGNNRSLSWELDSLLTVLRIDVPRIRGFLRNLWLLLGNEQLLCRLLPALQLLWISELSSKHPFHSRQASELGSETSPSHAGGPVATSHSKPCTIVSRWNVGRLVNGKHSTSSDLGCAEPSKPPEPTQGWRIAAVEAA